MQLWVSNGRRWRMDKFAVVRYEDCFESESRKDNGGKNYNLIDTTMMLILVMVIFRNRTKLHETSGLALRSAKPQRQNR